MAAVIASQSGTEFKLKILFPDAIVKDSQKRVLA